jgi:hypothetical protein
MFQELHVKPLHLAILFKFCLFIFGCAGSSLLLSGYSPVAVCWPLIVTASVFAEHKL